MKTLTPRELEIERVKLAIMATDIRIEEHKIGIVAMQRKNAARIRELNRQQKLEAAREVKSSK
jgi:hypothetical protein